MAGAWGGVDAKRLREDIVLLHLLRGNNGQTEFNAVPDGIRHRPAPVLRVLSFEDERNIVDTFAFISAFTDRPEKVSAVCVEEGLDGQSMVIKLAANDGELAESKAAFTKIARILEQVATKGLFFLIARPRLGFTDDEAGRSQESREALFSEIIAFDRRRILSRLRSRHAAKSPKIENKVSPVKRMGNALEQLRLHGTLPLGKEQREIESKFQDLKHTFLQLEAKGLNTAGSSAFDKYLKIIVKVADSICTQHDLDQILSSIPASGFFGPDDRTGLLMSFGKIGRYYSCQQFLIKIARKFAVFKKIRVQCVKVPVPRDFILSLKAQKSSLSSTSGRIINAKPVKERSKLADLVTVNQRLGQRSAVAHFDAIWSRPVKSYRIHAEVQLLFSYERKGKGVVPRVICSSKSACYLCNLLLRCHGGFYVPSTHGLLYPNWAMPDFQAIGLPKSSTARMKAVLQILITELESAIVSEVEKNSRKQFHGNESYVYHPPTPSASSDSHASSATVRAITSALPSIPHNFSPVPSASHPPPQQVSAESVQAKQAANPATSPADAISLASVTERQDESARNSTIRSTHGNQPDLVDQDEHEESRQKQIQLLDSDQGLPQNSTDRLIPTPEQTSPGPQSPVSAISSSDTLPLSGLSLADSVSLQEAGTSVQLRLPAGIPPAVVKSETLHLILSLDIDVEQRKPVQRVAKVRWIASGGTVLDGPEVDKGSGPRQQIIDVDAMVAGADMTLDCEPAGCAHLWLRCRGETFVLELGEEERKRG